jgi:hypothetical protein
LEGEIRGCDGSRVAARGRQTGLGCVVGVRGGRNRAVIAAVCGRQLRRWVFTANANAPENGADRLLVGAGLGDADHRAGRSADLLDLSLGAGTLGDRGQLALGH